MQNPIAFVCCYGEMTGVGTYIRQESYSRPYWGECIIARLMGVKCFRCKEINLTFQLHVVDIYQNN